MFFDLGAWSFRPGCFFLKAFACTLIILYFAATDLLGANESSIEELYHQTLKKSSEVGKHIQEIAHKYQVRRVGVFKEHSSNPSFHTIERQGFTGMYI